MDFVSLQLRVHARVRGNATRADGNEERKKTAVFVVTKTQALGPVAFMTSLKIRVEGSSPLSFDCCTVTPPFSMCVFLSGVLK